MGLVADVHDAATPWTGSLHTLSADVARQFRDQFKDVGSATVVVPRNHADAGWLTKGRYVKLAIDGTTRFCFRITQRRQVTVAEGEEAVELRTAAGPGVLATLADARIEPAWTVAAYFRADTRYFNFAAPDYPFDGDPAYGWGTAVKVFDFGDPAGYGPNIPKDWPEPSADWIWGTAPSGSPPMPVGSCYFRNDFYMSSAGNVAFYIAADDGYELWVDGELLADQTQEFIWRDTRRVVRYLSAGYHYVALKGTNIVRPLVASNYAAIIFAAIKLTGAGENGTTLLVSDTSWSANPYPAVPPGWTVGAVLDTLMWEGVGRGALQQWSWVFDYLNDSLGVPWTQLISPAYKIGTTYLDVLRQLATWAADFGVDHDAIELLLYPYESVGSATGVNVGIGQHLETLDHDESFNLITAGLARVRGGTYVPFDSGVSPRVEGYVELGVADNDDDAATQSTALTDVYAQPPTGVTARIAADAGVVPYDDFMPGDTVVMADIDLALTATTVRSITVTDRAPSDDGKVAGSLVYDVECEQ